MTDQEAAAAVRRAYAEAGSPNGPACRSATCLCVADTRVFWPVLAGEDWPAYCRPCADKALAVLSALGLSARSEALPRDERQGPRAVSLDGSLAPAKGGRP